MEYDAWLRQRTFNRRCVILEIITRTFVYFGIGFAASPVIFPQENGATFIAIGVAIVLVGIFGWTTTVALRRRGPKAK